jgi:predicted ATPase
VLRERFAAVRAGQGSLVLIGGEAGVGKTALAESLAYEAATWGALVLTGRCYDLMETPPYGPWTEIRDHAPVIPDLPPLPSAVTSTAASQAELFREALASFAALAARQPLVLILDDLQWADPASLDLLRFLARSVVSLPILLLATYRAEEVTRRHPLYPLLPLLLREAGATPIELHRLPIADVATLVTDRYRLPEAEATRLVTYLHERAGGNAFFTLELLRALEEEGVLAEEPEGWTVGDLASVQVPLLLRQVIDSRLARLGAEAERLLAVAAVIGQTVPLALWESVGETDEDALLDLIERAGAVRGLSEGHALWAQYHRAAGDRERACEEAKQALVHATEPRQPLALIAAHRLLGELDTDAGRYEDAEMHLQSSLDLADACAAPYERALTLLAMAKLRVATDEADAARALLDEVQAICEPLGAKPALARAETLAARLTQA